MLTNKGYIFQRADLDRYVKLTHAEKHLDNGASIYFDMSNGMNSAYKTIESQQLLQAIVNKLASNDAITFSGLADNKIFPLQMSHTQLFNHIMSSSNYKKQSAPIEKALSQIIKKRQPALLMTDFEEYRDGVIEKAAYAKKYFIDWLEMGYQISFYKWDYTEAGKLKHMYLAVFDDNACRLKSLVADVIAVCGHSIDEYVLGGYDFAFPTMTRYDSLKKGGNYHNGDGIDNVTNVMEKGGADDYISYARTLANAEGQQGRFASLDYLIGDFSEYYPIGVSWKEAINNAKQLSESKSAPFTHLLQNLYVDFGAQSGYDIDKIEIRVFDMQKTVEKIASLKITVPSDSTNLTAISLEAIDKPEINEMLIASTSPFNDTWQHITVDFDADFTGEESQTFKPANLLRANIVIADARPRLNGIDEFFGWTGNLSLANSVKETLMAPTSNPTGRTIFSYYFKCVGL